MHSNLEQSGLDSNSPLKKRAEVLLIKFLKMALWGKTISLEESYYNLSDDEWEDFLQMAHRQVVMALAWDGYLSSGITIPTKIKLKWFGNVVISYENRYSNYEKSIFKLASFYAKHGIKMLILKGYGLSLNYPIPNHRPCGDIDIYLYGEYERADKLLEERGISIDRNHHLHTVFHFDKQVVENHWEFLNSDVYKSTKRIKEILDQDIAEGNAKQHTIKLKADDGFEKEVVVYFPSVLFNSLYLLHHTAKHFAAEQINIRHLLDWITFVHSNIPELDWNYLFAISKEVGLDRFLHTLNHIAVLYFGAIEKEFPFDVSLSLGEKVFEEILHPKFARSRHKSIFKRLIYNYKKVVYNNWKRKIVYPESTLYFLFAKLKTKVVSFKK